MSASDDRALEVLIKRLKSFPESAMRREVLIERMLQMEPPEILGLFSEVEAGAARRSPMHLIVLEAIHEAILSGQAYGPLYELLMEVYRLARKDGNEGVARMMMIARPSRGPCQEREVPGDHELSRLPLGERKYLARGHDRIRLDRLLYDPDPTVVMNLLRNPHLTEQDVIRLAARRPTLTEIQRAIYKSRWGERYRIRFALVCNPYTPTELSLKLVGFLLRKELGQVSHDGNLHQFVRDEARRLFDQRTMGGRVVKGDPSGAADEDKH